MIYVVHILVLIDITGVWLILYVFGIPYGYLGMESGCKSQEVDPAPVTKKAKNSLTLNYSLITYYVYYILQKEFNFIVV